VMGSPAGEEGRDDNEGPQHRVTIARPFAVGRLEVTRGEWARFVTATGHKAEGGCYVWEWKMWAGAELKLEADRGWRDPGFPQQDDHPAVCVSWKDAKAYAAWLARETGEPYRLPSEAEWEYAARANTETRRYWGEDGADSEGCRYANVADQTAKERFSGLRTMACRDGHVFTAPTGSFEPNGFGLRDTLGNAWEWVEDCYYDSYNNAPSDGEPRIEEYCPSRAVRGGSWDVGPWLLRAAKRHPLAPEARDNGSGFRVARVLTL
jgi:formylglycine-generating enzyme required for sulfatase activity